MIKDFCKKNKLNTAWFYIWLLTVLLIAMQAFEFRLQRQADAFRVILFGRVVVLDLALVMKAPSDEVTNNVTFYSINDIDAYVRIGAISELEKLPILEKLAGSNLDTFCGLARIKLPHQAQYFYHDDESYLHLKGIKSEYVINIEKQLCEL